MDPFTIRRISAILNGYIATKVPHYVRDSVSLSYTIEGNTVTLEEEMMPLSPNEKTKTAIVQFCYEERLWTVYCMDQATGCWQPAASIQPSSCFESQLELVELDHEGVFWQLERC